MSVRPAQRRIILWTVPRSGSSAFYRSMMNRASVKTFMEPFCSAYYFGPERISQRYRSQHIMMNYSYSHIMDSLQQPFDEVDCVFSKDVPYALNGRLNYLPEGYQHTFLIRHPKQALTSFYKVTTDKLATGWDYFDPSEAGYKEMWDLVQYIHQKEGQCPLIMDYQDLVDRPEEMLKTFCEVTGLTYEPSMLEWKELSDEEFNLAFGGWPKGWFSGLLSAKTISKGVTSTHTELPKEVKKAVEENMPAYEQMFSLRHQLKKDDEQ